RRDAELFGEAQGDALALRRKVHGRLGIREAVRAHYLLDRVAERADVAGDLARVVDVPAAVQDVDWDPPRGRQDGGVPGARALAAGVREEQQGAEGDQSQRRRAQREQAWKRIPLD